jgi:hypothetical protein
MQKVVGSSPIIRSRKAPLRRGFCCLATHRGLRKIPASAFSVPKRRKLLALGPSATYVDSGLGLPQLLHQSRANGAAE